MKNITKFLIHLFIFLMLVLPVISFAQTEGPKGLVPCDNKTEATKCDFNAFMALINNVINFIFKFLVVPIAAVMFAYAGFLLIIAPGGEAKTKAKGIFTNAVIGLVFAAAAWLIVKALLTILGYKYIGDFF